MTDSDNGVMSFKAITKPSAIKHDNLPGPMVRVVIGNTTLWLNPEQAHVAGVSLINLSAMVRDARR